ncbi:MAG: recombination protein RecR [Hymenobacteraceae bacterium]|nr:recombination protein RecR [Hymenobacteraceae bacterium]
MDFPSKLIESAVEELAKLPGVGRKTALRLTLHLLRAEEGGTLALATALTRMRTGVTYCQQCHNIADTPVCDICTNPLRDRALVCTVSDIRDVIAIENTGQYRGLYHVLGGVISPLEGIGPSELNIPTLLDRISGPDAEIREVILALSPTMEGDTTAFYLTRKLRDAGVRVSSIARGVPVGGELEYTDEITLGRSIVERITQG